MADHAPSGRGLSGAARTDPALDVFPPRAADPQRLEEARRLFARPARFVAAAAATLPVEALPEIAFAGRSNVGKSSLINALCGRRQLARTSNTPGRTRQINFFEIDGRLALVDLPGYGYAEASQSAIGAWTRLVRHYLRSRAGLRRVCLLIDSRHGIKPPDRPLMEMLDEAGVSYQLALTKTDKIAAAPLARILEAIAAERAAHPAAHPEVHLTSARTGRGIAALREMLCGFALAEAPRCALAPGAAGH